MALTGPSPADTLAAMSIESPKHVTMIGTGLLGGSIGLAIRQRWPETHVAGVGRRQSSIDEALRCGVVHSAGLDAVEPASRSDWILLATPVGAFEKQLQAIQPVLRDDAVVTDVGSTKARVVQLGEAILGKGGAFVGSHPMAGNERKGPSHATADLIRDALCIVTPSPHTPEPLAERVENFWREIGMRTTRLGPDEHDLALARVSHVPHVLACLLMLLPDDCDLGVSATGFRDMTRLAGGDPEMWRDILATNHRAIRSALRSYRQSLDAFDALLANPDRTKLEDFFAKAKSRRDETIAPDLQTDRPTE